VADCFFSGGDGENLRFLFYLLGLLHTKKRQIEIVREWKNIMYFTLQGLQPPKSEGFYETAAKNRR
jgi:hypothetical protein